MNWFRFSSYSDIKTRTEFVQTYIEDTLLVALPFSIYFFPLSSLSLLLPILTVSDTIPVIIYIPFYCGVGRWTNCIPIIWGAYHGHGPEISRRGARHLFIHMILCVLPFASIWLWLDVKYAIIFWAMMGTDGRETVRQSVRPKDRGHYRQEWNGIFNSLRSGKGRVGFCCCCCGLLSADSNLFHAPVLESVRKSSSTYLCADMPSQSYYYQ